jgi:hypothetical protein
MLKADCKLKNCYRVETVIFIQDLRTFQVEIIHSSDVPFDFSE